MTDNPLLAPWTTAFGEPPFSRIRLEHFRPAFDAAFAEWNAEREAIKATPEPPTFENTILGWSAPARRSTGSSACSSTSSARPKRAIEAIEREIAAAAGARTQRGVSSTTRCSSASTRPRRAWPPASTRRRSGWSSALACLRRAGAGLPARAQATARRDRRAAGVARRGVRPERARRRAGLSRCCSTRETELEGLSRISRAARRPSGGRGARPCREMAVTLSRSSIEPFLQFSARRDLREKVWRAFVSRGATGRARQWPDHERRRWRCAPKRRACSATRPGRLQARRHHGQHARRRRST